MLLDMTAFGGDANWSTKAADGTPGQAAGIVAGTMVATPMGWRPIEAIVAGDEVMTFDGGLQRVQAVSRTVLWINQDQECPEALWPLRVEAGVLGNNRTMRLLPEETVVLESDAAEEAFGDPFALIPARALEDLPGVDRERPQGLVEVIQLGFKKDQVIFVEGSALVFCAATVAGQPVSLSQLVDAQGEASGYQVLSMEDARLLAACFQMEQASNGTSLAGRTQTPAYVA